MYERRGPSSPRAVLLLVHGLGAHTGRWDFLADFFAANDIASYAIELKGFGVTPQRKGDIDSFATYTNDVYSLRDIIATEYPSKKIFIVGESMGALIAFLAAAGRPALFTGLICISPAFKNRMKFPFLYQLQVFAAVILHPRRQFMMPFNAAMCTRDERYRAVMDADPREHRWATARLLLSIVCAQLVAPFFAAKITLPTLFALAGDDRMIDARASKKIFTKLRTKDKTLMGYPGYFHALAIDEGREKVFADLLAWIRQRGEA
ncbi:MAG: lysophospholipase [Candidatus Omnitrophota bacterium]